MEERGLTFLTLEQIAGFLTLLEEGVYEGVSQVVHLRTYVEADDVAVLRLAHHELDFLA